MLRNASRAKKDDAYWERMGSHIKESMKKSHPESSDWSEERKDAYIYGGKRNRGWRPKRERIVRALRRQK